MYEYLGAIIRRAEPCDRPKPRRKSPTKRLQAVCKKFKNEKKYD